MKQYGKGVYSNCYASDHNLYSKCPPLADTLASSHLGKFFTPLAMDFCSKTVHICCLQLGNCFGYLKVFVADATSKDVHGLI